MIHNIDQIEINDIYNNKYIMDIVNPNDFKDLQTIITDNFVNVSIPHLYIGALDANGGYYSGAPGAYTDYIRDFSKIIVNNNYFIYAYQKFTKYGDLIEYVSMLDTNEFITSSEYQYRLQFKLKSDINYYIKEEELNNIILEFKQFNRFVTTKNITWDETCNMNDFKTPGIYEIYGERTVKTDNLPIMNEGSGHSIAGKLTVVASTLQPNNTEICVTQFLQLSNRVGGEGATYIRTYNENNNGMNGWSPWQKQMGMVETVVNTDTDSFGSDIFTKGYAVSTGNGLNGMIDNGMYSGIYTDGIAYGGIWDNNLGKPIYIIEPDNMDFLETFVLVVINDYAASGKLNLPRHITQLKYAVDAITGQSSVKKRVGTGNDTISWGDWNELDGTKTIIWGSSSNINTFVTAGTYDIYGERTNTEDNLPINNSNPGNTIHAKLEVLDSSIPDSSKDTDKCITQKLTLSNRVGGDGNIYIRTGRGKTYDSINWEPWASLQTNINVGILTDYSSFNNFIDNGIYSGAFTLLDYETFVMVVINDYDISSKWGYSRKISQFKYTLTSRGEVKFQTRTGTGSNTITWNDWSDINEDNIKNLINTEISKLANTDADLINRIQQLVDWMTEHGTEVEAITSAIATNATAIEAEEQRAITAEDVLQKGIDAQGVALEKEVEAIKNGSTIVGQAREVYSLTGRTDDDNFLIRTTAGRNTIGDGVASIKKIGGNIVKNLVGDFNDKNAGRIDFKEIGGYYFLTTKTTNSAGDTAVRLNSRSTIVGHKYYVAFNAKSGYPISAFIKIFSSTNYLFLRKNIADCTYLSTVVTAEDAQSTILIYPYGYVGNTNIGDIAMFSHPLMIDLTEMFGAGNEPDKDTCDKLFGSMDALPQGLTIANPTAFKSVGYNQFNPENVLKGKTIDENGAIVDNPATDIAVVPCLPCKVGVGENNGYCIHGEFEDSDIKVYLTPLNPMEVDGDLYMHELTPDATKGTYVPLIKGYMLIVTPSTHNLCCHFLWGEDRNKHDYEPYVESVVELPTIPQMSEWGLAGIKTSGTPVCDEIDFERGVYIKRVGAVDLGSLSWVYDTANSAFRTTINTMKPSQTSKEYVSGFVQDKYNIDNTSGVSTMTDKSARRYNKSIYIKDSSYTNATSFKDSLQGTMLYYELETPEEYPISTKALNYIGSDYGTEQFLGTKVPLNANTLYYMRSLVGETRNFLDKMYNNTKKESANEVADYITNGIEENKAKAEEAPNLALRSLFIAAGAEYNDTDTDTTKTTPWGETVTHKAGHYYLNGLGDITEAQMTKIYNRGYFNDDDKCPLGYSTWHSIRTNLGRKGMWNPTIKGSYFAYSTQQETLILHIYLQSKDSGNVSFSSETNVAYFCGNSPKLRIIDPRMTLTCNKWDDTSFISCPALEEVRVKYLKSNIVFKDSPVLSKATVLCMIQNAAPTIAITITLHQDAYARLAEDAEIVAALEAQPLITLVTAE